MASGVFEYVDNSHIIFEGQLKRHIEELVAHEKIPVLGNAAREVVEAIEWLEKTETRYYISSLSETAEAFASGIKG